ncbi:hypothetical protein M9H77_18863 [Catharanthus roseus]|uniref:Uncharacterized protein n=1 Tax=Catharanthus roseus TaxID=4058 RepID=A0ACC0B8R0_CATRO|nr:hypothetical protein M9H77_18863 [Catharanthus roseus]
MVGISRQRPTVDCRPRPTIGSRYDFALLVTIARARKIKEHDDSCTIGLLKFVEEATNDVLNFKFEGLEDGFKDSKVFMLHSISKKQQMEPVGGENMAKHPKLEPAYPISFYSNC